MQPRIDGSSECWKPPDKKIAICNSTIEERQTNEVMSSEMFVYPRNK